jgi:hypothetical protein
VAFIDLIIHDNTCVRLGMEVQVGKRVGSSFISMVQAFVSKFPEMTELENLCSH